MWYNPCNGGYSNGNHYFTKKNDKIKRAKKLTRRKYQKDYDRYLLEGPHLVREAIASGALPETLFVTSKYMHEQAVRDFYDQTIEISSEVAQHLAETPTPQGMFAVMPLPHEELPTDLNGSFLLLDAIQDPGNVGTMVRTADAAGIDTVVLGNGTADAYSPKVLRAMQGSQFHVRVVSANLNHLLPQLKAAGVPVFGTELNDQALPYTDVAPTTNFALVMGNEGNGMDPELLAQTDQNLYIPMRGRAESLNVGVAAGVVLFHLLA